MLIDFHTHIFPDDLAAVAIRKLQEIVSSVQGVPFRAFADGTAAGLDASMTENGVDVSVILPVVVKPEQARKVNGFVLKTRSERIRAFAGVHPMQPDWEETLEDIAAQGFPGIKLQPESQRFYIDCRESVRIFQKAEQLGLLVLIHAGVDIGYAPPVHCTPERLARVLQIVSGRNLIAAHLGGYQMWDDVEKYLVGSPVYMDTAYLSAGIDPVQCRRIIVRHGADKILFGSDSPWKRPADVLSFLQSLHLPEEDIEKITWKNAKKLLD